MKVMIIYKKANFKESFEKIKKKQILRSSETEPLWPNAKAFCLNNKTKSTLVMDYPSTKEP